MIVTLTVILLSVIMATMVTIVSIVTIINLTPKIVSHFYVSSKRKKMYKIFSYRPDIRKISRISEKLKSNAAK